MNKERYFISHCVNNCHEEMYNHLYTPKHIMIYIFAGEWVHSPEEMAKKDKNPVMLLLPAVGNESLGVYGDVGEITEIGKDVFDILVELYQNKMSKAYNWIAHKVIKENEDVMVNCNN